MDVRILGTLEASDCERSIDLGLRQARTLFAVLALQPGSPVRTATLAEALWPGGPPQKWDAAVQSHVSRLRRALEPDRPPRSPSTRLLTQGEAYVLNLEDDELDARRFERLAASGRGALGRGEYERAAELLSCALEEWRGPVLADFRDPGILGAEVNRLEELRLLTMEDRAEAAIALGRHGRAVSDLEVLVEEYPLRERCWELLLMSLYRSGRQSEALRRYQEVRTLLVEELGIEPGPALAQVEAAILRHDAGLVPAVSGTTAAAAVEVAPPAWLQAPADQFVGRTAELAAVQESFERTCAGERRLALVVGEPGIGKTRLLREACRHLGAAGAVVLGGRCVEEPLHVLEPFADAVGKLALAQADRLAREAPTETAALAALVPELARRAPDLAPADSEAQRYLLFRAVSGLVDSRSLGGPAVVVLDDLHWAAPASLQLLVHLLGDDDRGALLVLATARDTERNDQLAAVAADLQRERRFDRIPLAGLSAPEVTALAEARGADTSRANYYETAEGNPFYVEELVRHVAESGGELGAGKLPDSVRDTIARRVLRLPGEVRRVLGIAAVAAREFRLDVVARAAQMGLDEADDALQVAASAGIVWEHTSRPGVYGFSHALIQAVLRDGLGAARRARVHRRFGDALVELDGDRSEVARHLLAAAADGSDVVPGVEAALAAGQAALERYTYDDAVAILRAAWVALEHSRERGSVLVCRVALALAAALRRCGAYEERQPLVEQAWGQACRLGDPELRADVIIEGCAGIMFPAEPWPSRAESTIAELGETCAHRIHLTALLCYMRSGEPGDRARPLAEWALARTAQLAPRGRCAVIEYCLPVVAASSPVERVVDLARAALAAARAEGSVFELIEALSVLRRAHLSAGDLGASDAIAREYEALVRAVGTPRYMAGVEQRRAMRSLLAGRFTEAEAHAAEAISLQPIPEFIEGWAVQIFAARFEQGRLDEVRPAVEAWARQGERPAWVVGYAALLAETGESDEAAEVLGPLARAGFETVPRDELYFLSLAAAATAVVVTGDRDAAGVLYGLLSPHASRVIVAGEGVLCWGSVQRFLGPLGSVLGDAARAAMHFEAAMSVHERLGARPFLARDRLAYASLLQESGGDGVRIEELARTGLALASELGTRGVMERYGELTP